LVHRRADRAGEVRRPAGVHVKIAAARAVELLLDPSDAGVIIGDGDGLEGPARAGRIPEAAGWSGAWEGVGTLQRCTTPRRHDAEERPGSERQERTAVQV